ncbi:MAG: fibronectin type III domain-containing protein, partial [Alistipes sp.]|nr:fibronectin type III domain-containing protein [Alistipes sp.]
SAPLPAPADVVAQMVDEQSISLSWSAVTNAQSYNIYRNGEYIANTANVNYTDTGLNSATEYNYCVAAVYNGKVYEASAEVSATTDKADYNVVVKSYSPATLSPGENTLYVTMLNNGRYELHTKCTVTFSCDDPYVTINSGNFTIAALSPDATAEKSITVTVSDEAPNGHVVNFAVNVKEQYSPYYNWDFTSSIVVYNEDAVDISEQRATAMALVDGWGGVGYPVASAIEEYLAAVDAANHAEDITAAQTTLYTAEIQMPEDGKAYTFTNVQKNGSEFVMGYDANNQMAFKNVVTTAEFICRDLGDGKYAFVDNNGHYLAYKCRANNDVSNKYEEGYTDSYVETWTDLTITPMQNGGNVSAGSQLNVMGFVVMRGNRVKTVNDAETVESDVYFVIKNTGDYDGARSAYYNDTYSSAFRMKEVDYANKPTLNSIGGSALITNFEQEALATFSAPFPTVLPEGVTAFYAKRDDCNSEVISLTAYEGDALPANQGFILAGDAGAITMVPAAGEATVDISGENVMGHSAGAAKELSENSGYILAGGSQGPGFYATGAGTLAMNKAYLALSGTDLTGMRSVVIRFPGLTDIDRATVDGMGMDDAVIYDLSGRRVDNPSRGIYIVNGKKLYVK